LPPQVNPVNPFSNALAVDFQDLGSDNVYRLQFPDLDDTWTFPSIGETFNAGVPYPYQTNWGNGQSGSGGSSPPNLNTQCSYNVPTRVVAFSPDCQIVAIALTQFNSVGLVDPHITTTYSNRIRVYSIGTTLTSAGVLDQAANLYALKATLIADYQWAVFGYGITDQYDPNVVAGTNNTVITQWSIPYNLLVTSSGPEGPYGYGVYWLEYCDIGCGPVTSLGASFIQTWVSHSNLPALPAPAQDPTLLPTSLVPTPHPTTASWISGGHQQVINTTLVNPNMALVFLNKMVVISGHAVTAQRLSTTLMTVCGGQNNVSQTPGAGPAPNQSLTRLLPIDLISIDEENGKYLCFALINTHLDDLTADDPTNNLNQTATTVQFAVVNLIVPDPSWATFQSGGTVYVGPGSPGTLTPVLITRPVQSFPTVVWFDPNAWTNGYSPATVTQFGITNGLLSQDGVYKTKSAWTATVGVITGQPTPVVAYTVYLGDLPAQNVSIYPMTVNPIILPYGNPAYNPNNTKYSSGYPFTTYFFDINHTSGFFQAMYFSLTSGGQTNPTLDQIYTATITTNPNNISVTTTALPIGRTNTLPTYYNVTSPYWGTTSNIPSALQNYNTTMQQSKG